MICAFLLHQNIRSIRNKLDNIKAHLFDFDIRCFTESKLFVDIKDNFIYFDGFDQLYRKENAVKACGLLVYVSSRVYSVRNIERANSLP